MTSIAYIGIWVAPYFYSSIYKYLNNLRVFKSSEASLSCHIHSRAPGLLLNVGKFIAKYIFK